MFYSRSSVCRYVEVMSGKIKSVQKLELKNLDDARIRNSESRMTESGTKNCPNLGKKCENYLAEDDLASAKR